MKRRTASTGGSKLNPAWAKQVKREFLDSLQATHFPEPECNGTRDNTAAYPEKRTQPRMVPTGLHGLERERSFSRANGWGYGHGTFCISQHEPSVSAS
jgi:hypothetical protein